VECTHLQVWQFKHGAPQQQQQQQQQEGRTCIVLQALRMLLIAMGCSLCIPSTHLKPWVLEQKQGDAGGELGSPKSAGLHVRTPLHTPAQICTPRSHTPRESHTLWPYVCVQSCAKRYSWPSCTTGGPAMREACCQDLTGLRGCCSQGPFRLGDDLGVNRFSHLWSHSEYTNGIPQGVRYA